MKLERDGPVGILTIDTTRNNAINLDFIEEAHARMDEAEADPGIRSLVVTATHPSVFCPGIDLPDLLPRDQAGMRRFFSAITGLACRKFAFPKPEVYALNGHAIAGGCVMALTGDVRLMARGRYQIGLLEVDLGLSASAGMVEIVAYVLGRRGAERLLAAGGLLTPEEALARGLVDELVEPDLLMTRALERARGLAEKPPLAYATLKRYVRAPVTEAIRSLDETHLDDLVALWFSEETQRRLQDTVERLRTRARA